MDRVSRAGRAAWVVGLVSLVLLVAVAPARGALPNRPVEGGLSCWSASWCTAVARRYVATFSQPGFALNAHGEVGNGSFGSTVALSADGSTAAVGGISDDGFAGAVWVFVRSGGAWIQQGPKLTPNDKAGSGWFGSSVSLSADGDTLLVGARYGIGGAGGAWIFTRSGSTWTQQGPKLTGTGETGSTSALGWSVALSGDGQTALVGGQGDNGNVGAAWVFTRSGSMWTQQGPKLTGDDESGSGVFGGAVALSSDGNTALIGGSNDNGLSGAVWVFTRSDSRWTQQGPKLTPSDENGAAGFGSSVALSSDGGTALVGGQNDDSDVGAAWVFTRSGSQWTQQGSKLMPTDEAGAGGFGFSVGISGNAETALIGGADDNGSAGAGWVFTNSSGTWTQQGPKLTVSHGSARLGWSAALSADGTTALLGAPGGPADGSQVGGAYMFATGAAAPPVATGPAAPPVLASNRFTISNVRTSTDGTVGFSIRAPGPGSVEVLETAWNDNLAKTASVAQADVLLQPAAHRFVFARAHTQAAGASTIHVVVKPNPRGVLLVHHHTYRIPLRLWVTYIPTSGRPASIGIYGIHLGLSCTPVPQRGAAASRSHFACPVGRLP